MGSSRSLRRRPNIALAVVVTAVGLVLALAQFVAPVRALLSFGVLGAAEAAYIVLTAMIVFVLLETLKRLLRIGAGTRASGAVTPQPMQPVVSELPAER